MEVDKGVRWVDNGGEVCDEVNEKMDAGEDR